MPKKHFMYQIFSESNDKKYGGKSAYLYGKWNLIWFLITNKYNEKRYSNDSVIDIRIYI